MSLRAAKGVTLLEILIVLAISAILAGVGYASLRKMMERSRLDAAAAQVETDIVRARSYAQTKNFAATWKKVSDTSYQLILGTEVKQYDLPRGVKFAEPAGNAEVKYLAPYGEVSINGSTVAALKIILDNEKGKSFEIHVVGVTGKVIRQ